MDTTVLQFYPTLFALATDVIDLLGDMVWERIRQKAEYAEDGTFFCSLPGIASKHLDTSFMHILFSFNSQNILSFIPVLL